MFRPSISYSSIIIGLLYLSTFSGISYAEDQIQILACECPPLSYKEYGIAAGPLVDIVNVIQLRTKTNNPISIHPWARGYITAKENPNHMLFATARTSHREDMFKWVGPIVTKQFNFYARKNSPIHITSINDAKNYRIGVVIGSNNEQHLISNGFTNIHSVTHEKENLGKLLFNRIDLWYTDSTQSKIITSNIASKNLIKPVLKIKTIDSYFAFNKKTSDKTVGLWQTELKKLHRDGTIKRILLKYNLQNLNPKQLKY